MSTRANIKLINKSGDVLWFYRHFDGYPEGALPLLEKFLNFIKEGKIRNNISQAGGWLIMFGAKEYEKDTEGVIKDITLPTDDVLSGWKVGSIEPTTEQHGDIDYLYVVDLDAKTITNTPFKRGGVVA